MLRQRMLDFHRVKGAETAEANSQLSAGAKRATVLVYQVAAGVCFQTISDLERHGRRTHR
jgi:hypothetical protein